MRRLLKTIFIAASFLSFASASALARDMQGRLGVGYNSQFANTETTNGVPGISLKYGMTRDFAAEAVLGLSTRTPTNSVVGIKFFKNIFYETNLNFYFMFGGGLINANRKSSSQFLGGLGTEFFIPGLESLGFSVETGASLDNVSGSYALSTMGVSFLDAGIHFYF